METGKLMLRMNINIIGPDHFKTSTELSETDLELDQNEEDDDFYIEAEVQTSNVEIPEGNRWRWSRLHKEVELQTSIISVPLVEAEAEAEAQFQTSFSTKPTEANVHAQTSFVSLRSPTPVNTDAQIQTSFAELRRLCEAEAFVRRLLLSSSEEKKIQEQTSLLSIHGEMEAWRRTSPVAIPEEKEAQVQTSLSSLPEEKEAQVQTSLPFLPEEKEAQVQTSLSSLPEEKEIQVQTSLLSIPERVETQVQTSLLSLPEEKEVEVQTSFISLPEREPAEFLTESVQTQPLYLELLEKIVSLPILVEAKVQTSPTDIYIPPQTDMQVQTSFSDYTLEKTDVSVEKELQSKLSLYPTYINAEVQTLPVEAPPGNDWRTARLIAEAQVQTSFISGTESPEIQEYPSELELEKEEWGAPLPIEKKSLPFQLTETSAQTSDTLIRDWDKWRLLHPQASAQVQTSAVELLKQLSLLSQIETMEPLSHAEILKNVSSLSVAEPELYRSSHELMRKASSWSDIETQDRIFSDEHLGKRPFSAQALPTSEYEPAAPFSSSLFKKEAEVQTSDLELMKKLSSLSQTELREQYSSLSLIEADSENQEVTEGKEYLITPQVIEAQIRKWYNELPEFQTSASQTAFKKDHLWSGTVDNEVQTSYVEIPFRNRWRASRLQAETETQTSELELAADEIESQRQPSLLEIWQARDLADAQRHSLILDSPKTMELPPPLVVDSEAQTSLFDIWKVKEQMDAQVQTSASELSKQGITFPSAEQVDNLTQTSFIDTWRAKELVNMQQQTSETDLEEAKLAHSQQLKADFEMQTSLEDIWRKKEKMDTQAQTSFIDIVEGNEEPSLVFQTGDAQVQTSDIAIPPDLYADFQQQTSLELEEPFPPSEREILPQVSLLDLWKAKEESHLVSKMDAQMQTSDTEMLQEDLWHPSHRYADFQQQTSLELEEAKIEASQMDAQIQTSLLDIWKTKELNNAQMQTSWIDFPESTEKMSFPSESEIPVQPSLVEEAESLPQGQVTAEVQTSSTEIWRIKDVTDTEIQTSLSYLTPSIQLFPVSQQTESSKQSSTPETLRVTKPTEDQIKTTMTELPDAQIFLTDMHAPEDLPNVQKQYPGSPLRSSPSFVDELSTRSHMDASHAPVLHKELPLAPSHMEVSPAPVHRHISPAPLSTKVSPAPLGIEEFPTVSHITASPFLPFITESQGSSQASSPRRPSTPASGFTKTESFRLEHSRALMQKSLLELWTMREEAVLQMQNANFGQSFEEDLRLFPKLVESPMKFPDVKIQDGKKTDQISTVEKKPKTPIFTEAQVQTSYVDIPRGKKWRSSRICTEAQVQTSSHEIRVKDRFPAIRDHTVAKSKVPKGPRRTAPLAVHLHIKMAAKH
ncbi:uro-adherence factor A-like [Erythrolamprus reginae]|uniref:uro-adherence factor A-like n=1 Tax=Erythrolamprus reginae TaxID=121349 RepID=UPI00396CA452